MLEPEHPPTIVSTGFCMRTFLRLTGPDFASLPAQVALAVCQTALGPQNARLRPQCRCGCLWLPAHPARVLKGLRHVLHGPMANPSTSHLPNTDPVRPVACDEPCLLTMWRTCLLLLLCPGTFDCRFSCRAVRF